MRHGELEGHLHGGDLLQRGAATCRAYVQTVLLATQPSNTIDHMVIPHEAFDIIRQHLTEHDANAIEDARRIEGTLCLDYQHDHDDNIATICLRPWNHPGACGSTRYLEAVARGRHHMDDAAARCQARLQQALTR